MKHTPGPWTVDHAHHFDEGFLRIIRDHRLERVAMIPDVARELEEARGDARLIAAAPDLLHALRLMLREHDALQMAEGSTEDRWTAAAVARTAIAKAEGQT